MTLNDILLVCAALLPAIALCVYVFKKDRAEKEPLGLLLMLFFCGVVICFPAAEIEGFLTEVLNTVFSPFMTEKDGILYMAKPYYKIYTVLKNFIGIALVEEGLKFVCLYLLTRKNKNFNSLFDGIIYSVFVSLGFAALENVLYVLKYGWINALTRAVMSVPGHMFFAVIMGYYYTMWNVKTKAKIMESELKHKGLIVNNLPPFGSGGYLFLGLLMPTLAHGWYDYCCTADTVLSTVSLYAFLVFLYIYCFGKIGKMSKADVNDNLYSLSFLIKKYPYLTEVFKSQQESQL